MVSAPGETFAPIFSNLCGFCKTVKLNRIVNIHCTYCANKPWPSDQRSWRKSNETTWRFSDLSHTNSSHWCPNSWPMTKANSSNILFILTFCCNDFYFLKFKYDYIIFLSLSLIQFHVFLQILLSFKKEITKIWHWYFLFLILGFLFVCLFQSSSLVFIKYLIIPSEWFMGDSNISLIYYDNQ